MAQAMTREELQEQQRRLTVYQDRYDQVLMPWGRKAPEPVLTESPGRYRRRVLSHAQLFLPENDQWRNVPSFDEMDSHTLGVVEGQILSALRAAANNPASVANSAAGSPIAWTLAFVWWNTTMPTDSRCAHSTGSRLSGISPGPAAV
jgi:hypothetical protein